jgi:RHS repeat-associated protein
MEPCLPRPRPRGAMSRIFRRFPRPAGVLFVLLTLLLFMSTLPARAGGAGITPGVCPPTGAAQCGDPVIFLGGTSPIGNVFQKVTDYTSAGLNPLVVNRYYNSRAGTPGGSFNFWRWTYDRALSIDLPDNEVDAYRPDGKDVTFSPSGNGWSGASDINLQLVQVSASTWTLTDWNDIVETYSVLNGGFAGLLTSIRYRDGYTQTLQYNANNQLILVTDSYGRTLSISWNGSNFISSITTPDGLVYNYSYTSTQNISNLLSAVTYPTSPPTSQQYLYGESNSGGIVLIGIIDEDGNPYTSWTYDPNYVFPRALTDQLAGAVGLTTIAYNNDGSITTTGPLGLQQTYKFSAVGPAQFTFLNTEIDRAANANSAAAVSKITYDSNGYVASYTDWNGNVTQYTNDARGDELTRVLASGTPQAETITTSWLSNYHLPTQIAEPARTTTFSYDGNGNLLSKTITWSFDNVVRPLVSAPVVQMRRPGGVSIFTNKRAGIQPGPPSSKRVGIQPVRPSSPPVQQPPGGGSSTWSYTYNATGEVLTATDPDGNTTTYSYDGSGNLTGVTNALGQVTSLSSYDTNGRPGKITDPNGLVTTFTYNFRGQVTSNTAGQWVTSYAYDPVGQLIKLTRPDGSFFAFTYDAAHRLTQIADAVGNQTVFTLDAAGNRTQVQVFNASSGLTRTRSFTYDAISRLLQAIGAQGQMTSYSYDANGNRTQITDPLAHVYSDAYDALNLLIQATDPNGGVTAYGYDSENRVTGVTDPRSLVTSYAYNGLNDLTSLGSPDTGATAETYDAAGNLVTSTDARGDTTTYSYDALNRLTKATFADSTSITHQYDQGTNGIGHLTAMTDAGGTTTWAYDINGQVISKQQTSGGVTLTTSHAYNATTGQLASTTYPSGATISYSYDADGRVSTMGYQPPGGAASSLLSEIAYQPFGPAASWTQGGGGSYRRTFDLDGRIVALALSPAGLDMALTYDADDRITGIAERNFPTKRLGYDALGRLTNYSTGAIVQPLSTMDAITQPPSPITFGATTQTYTYDANGNRTGFTAKAPLNTVALTYSYDTASNRLLGIGGSETDSFTYDANGNMLSHTSPFANYSYTYNARNRRSQASVGAVTTTDTINGLGERTAQSLVGRDFFVYDEAGHLIGSYNGRGGVIAETAWLGDLPVATMSPGTLLSPRGIFYIAPDQLGAPHEITNASGAVVWRWDHDPFGNGAPSGPLPYPLRFPGQYDDQLARLHYNLFRDYDPNTGRYIESDPIGLRGGLNTYSYVDGRPINHFDRGGLQSVTVNVGEQPQTIAGYTTWPPSGPNGVATVTAPNGDTFSVNQGETIRFPDGSQFSNNSSWTGDQYGPYSSTDTNGKVTSGQGPCPPDQNQIPNPTPQWPQPSQFPSGPEVEDYLNGKGVGPYPIAVDPNAPAWSPGVIPAIPPTAILPSISGSLFQ